MAPRIAGLSQMNRIPENTECRVAGSFGGTGRSMRMVPTSTLDAR